MTNVIVAGHAGYGTAIENSLAMILGSAEGFEYVDFNRDDSLETLDAKLRRAVALCKDNEILFTCDLAGGSPFKQSAMICVENSKYRAIAGINLATFAELVYNLTLSAGELSDLARDTMGITVVQFPPLT
ncbi:MAG: hypothetical protein RSF82_06820 [Angelakisella sp.]